MAGNTATIDFRTLRIQWSSHSSMAAICTHWTITRDQLIRLRDVLPLPKRHDRSLRFKPKRSEQCDPSEDEIWNRLVFKIQAGWTEEQELARRVTKPQAFSMRLIQTPDDMRRQVDDMNRQEGR